MPDGRAPKNVYAFIQRVGLENMIITPFLQVSPSAATAAEFASMNRWGTRSLLNTILPSHKLGQRWLWVLRRAAWKHERTLGAQANVRTEVKCVMSMVRVPITLPQYLHLLTTARPILPRSDYRDFFLRVQPKIEARFDLSLPYEILLRIPLISKDPKRNLMAAFARHTQRSPLVLPLSDSLDAEPQRSVISGPPLPPVNLQTGSCT